MLDRICVYCGSSPGKSTSYVEGAENLALELVRNDIELVYGGAGVGVMGALANSVLDNGGRVTGIIPGDLVSREVAHSRLTDLRIVSSMHERKSMMADLADGFIALPGGLGTLEELFEMLTWAQLGLHRKPVGILNIGGYFDLLSSFLDHAVNEGFVRKDHRRMIIIGEDSAAMIRRFKEYESPVVEKWIDRDST